MSVMPEEKFDMVAWEVRVTTEIRDAKARGLCGERNPRYPDFWCGKPAGHMDKWCEDEDSRRGVPGGDAVVWQNPRTISEEQRAFRAECDRLSALDWGDGRGRATR